MPKEAHRKDPSRARPRDGHLIPDSEGRPLAFPQLQFWTLLDHLKAGKDSVAYRERKSEWEN